MIIPKIKVFKKNFNIEISNYLVRFFKKSKKIIITSGKTIEPIYKNIDKLNFENKLFYLSDERLVSYNSKLSNFRNISKYNFVNKNKLFHFDINQICLFDELYFCFLIYKLTFLFMMFVVMLFMMFVVMIFIMFVLSIRSP